MQVVSYYRRPSSPDANRKYQTHVVGANRPRRPQALRDGEAAKKRR